VKTPHFLRHSLAFGEITVALGVLQMQVIGVVTAASFESLCKDYAAFFWHHQAAVQSIVVRAERAAWAITIDELNSIVKKILTPTGRPSAIVSAPETLGLFQAHAWAMAQIGMLIGTFTCDVLAYGWLARQAPLLEHARFRPALNQPVLTGPVLARSRKIRATA